MLRNVRGASRPPHTEPLDSSGGPVTYGAAAVGQGSAPSGWLPTLPAEAPQAWSAANEPQARLRLAPSADRRSADAASPPPPSQPARAGGRSSPAQTSTGGAYASMLNDVKVLMRGCKESLSSSEQQPPPTSQVRAAAARSAPLLESIEVDPTDLGASDQASSDLLAESRAHVETRAPPLPEAPPPPELSARSARPRHAARRGPLE